MKNRKLNLRKIGIGAGLVAGALVPGIARGCACGCGVFDVATSYMLPNGPGGMLFEQFAYQDQNHNWYGSSKASAANNGDKEIESYFTTLGLQYMFNRSWGVEAELPYSFRNFTGTDSSGKIASHNWSTLGDIRLQGIYTGFSPDMSSGVTFGLKLPTGKFHEDASLVDRDTQIGAGGADVLLGGFHRDKFTKSQDWEWFAQVLLDIPTIVQENYRAGIEFDSAAGLDYTGISLGGVKIVPVAQVLFSERGSDSGANADPESTGYQRILLSPGVEVQWNKFDIYGDAEFPVFQNFTGNQLAAPVMFKFAVSYMF